MGETALRTPSPGESDATTLHAHPTYPHGAVSLDDVGGGAYGPYHLRRYGDAGVVGVEVQHHARPTI